jgi:hypothetical protein
MKFKAFAHRVALVVAVVSTLGALPLHADCTSLAGPEGEGEQISNTDYTFCNEQPFDPETLHAQNDSNTSAHGLRLPAGATYVREGWTDLKGLQLNKCANVNDAEGTPSATCLPIEEAMLHNNSCQQPCFYDFERTCLQITNISKDDLFIPAHYPEEWGEIARGSSNELMVQECTRHFGAWEDTSGQNAALEAWFNKQPSGTPLSQSACGMVNRKCHPETVTITLSRRCLNALGIELDVAECLDDPLQPAADHALGAQQNITCTHDAMIAEDAPCCTPQVETRAIKCPEPATGYTLQTVNRECPSGAVTISELSNMCQPTEASVEITAHAASKRTTQAALTSVTPKVQPSPMPSRPYKSLPSRKFLKPCTFNGQSVASGHSVTAFQTASVAAGLVCISQNRVCNNGLLSGSYNFAACSVQPSRKLIKSCMFNGQSVASGQRVAAFKAASVGAGLVCISQDRVCTNGLLSGSYNFAACAVQPATSSQTELPLASPPYPATPLVDYLIQDVCVDEHDKPIPGDPATCPRHRDLKFGEFLPYIRYASLDSIRYPSASGSPIESFNSHPSLGNSGELLIFRPDQWGSAPFPGIASFRDTVLFDSTDGRSGFDVIDPNGPLMAIIATGNNENPSTHYWGAGCDRQAAWTLFPSTLAEGGTGSRTGTTGIGETCPSTYPWTVLNLWHFYQPTESILYANGAQLQSIVEWAFDDQDPMQSGHIEQLYFTKEYGVTRWENWQTPTYCAAHKPAGTNEHYCEPDNGLPNYTCNGANDLPDFFGHHYVRISCWDNSRIVTANPSYNPLTNPLGGSIIFSRNRLSHGDFAAGLTTGWNFPLALSHTVQMNNDKNHYIKIVAPAGATTAQKALSQEIDATQFSNARRLNWGLIGKASRTSTLTLTLRFLDSAGATLNAISKKFAVSASFTHMDDSLAWNSTQTPAARVRIEIAPDASSTDYDFDEIYLTPTLQ